MQACPQLAARITSESERASSPEAPCRDEPQAGLRYRSDRLARSIRPSSNELTPGRNHQSDGHGIGTGRLEVRRSKRPAGSVARSCSCSMSPYLEPSLPTSACCAAVSIYMPFSNERGVPAVSGAAVGASGRRFPSSARSKRHDGGRHRDARKDSGDVLGSFFRLRPGQRPLCRRAAPGPRGRRHCSLLRRSASAEGSAQDQTHHGHAGGAVREMRRACTEIIICTGFETRAAALGRSPPAYSATASRRADSPLPGRPAASRPRLGGWGGRRGVIPFIPKLAGRRRSWLTAISPNGAGAARGCPPPRGGRGHRSPPRCARRTGPL